VSKKLPPIRIIPVELKIDGKPAAESTQSLKQLIAIWLARDTELSRPSDMNFNLITFLKLEGVNNGCWKTNGEAVAPFGYLHDRPSCGYTSNDMCIHRYVKKTPSHSLVPSGLAPRLW
jgi:hypothetical protein